MTRCPSDVLVSTKDSGTWAAMIQPFSSVNVQVPNRLIECWCGWFTKLYPQHFRWKFRSNSHYFSPCHHHSSHTSVHSVSITWNSFSGAVAIVVLSISSDQISGKRTKWAGSWFLRGNYVMQKDCLRRGRGHSLGVYFGAWRPHKPRASRSWPNGMNSVAQAI